jgi:hypothetical protein
MTVSTRPQPQPHLKEDDMALTNWLPTPKFEDYKEFFKEHFEMERREDGVLFVCMHTLGGEVQWNAQLHRASIPKAGLR